MAQEVPLSVRLLIKDRKAGLPVGPVRSGTISPDCSFLRFARPQIGSNPGPDRQGRANPGTAGAAQRTARRLLSPACDAEATGEGGAGNARQHYACPTAATRTRSDARAGRWRPCGAVAVHGQQYPAMARVELADRIKHMTGSAADAKDDLTYSAAVNFDISCDGVHHSATRSRAISPSQTSSLSVHTW